MFNLWSAFLFGDAGERVAALLVVGMLEEGVGRVISAERFGADFSAGPAWYRAGSQ